VSVAATSAARAPKRRGAVDRPRWLWVVAGITGLWLFVPITVVVVFSFNDGRSLTSLSGLGLTWYRQVAGDPAIRGSVVASAQIAIATTVVATVLGTLLAFGIARARTRWRKVVQGTVLLNLVSPEMAMAVALLLLFTQVEVPLSNGAVMLGHVTFSIPFVAAIVGGRLAGLSYEYEEAALDLGATRWQAVRLVALPQLLPAIVAAGLLVFVLSFDDFVTSFFVSGVGTPPLPVRIYSMLRFGVSPAVNAIGTFMMVVALVAGALAVLVLRAGRARGDRRASVSSTLAGR
jgi:spermidine/putrescine transport system permease protein